MARKGLEVAQANEALALAAYKAAEGIQNVEPERRRRSPCGRPMLTASMLGLAGAIERANAAAVTMTPLQSLSTSAWYGGGSNDFYMGFRRARSHSRPPMAWLRSRAVRQSSGEYGDRQRLRAKMNAAAEKVKEQHRVPCRSRSRRAAGLTASHETSRRRRNGPSRTSTLRPTVG